MQLMIPDNLQVVLTDDEVGALYELIGELDLHDLIGHPGEEPLIEDIMMKCSNRLDYIL